MPYDWEGIGINVQECVHPIEKQTVWSAVGFCSTLLR